MFRNSRYRWFTLISALLTIVLLILRQALFAPPARSLQFVWTYDTPQKSIVLKQLSSDPYSNLPGQHSTEVEPDTYSFGSTIVTAFQVGRFSDGGSSNIGWATSTDGGLTWKSGFLPGTTKVTGGIYDRVSDPSVSYDAAHDTWMISSLGIVGSGSNLASPAVIVNLSTDGGLTWSMPVWVINGGSTYFDKDWIVCDNSTKSPFYGHCYVEWDDDNKGGLILMSTSTDGGQVWGLAQTTANSIHGLGGQPLVQPAGRVIVPISGYGDSRIYAFISNNGGASWSSTTVVAKIQGGTLPSAEIDASGKVYLVWSDCGFEKICTTGAGEDESADRDQNDSTDASNIERDLEMSTSSDGINWSPTQLLPIDPIGSGIDHLIPGIAVDRNTSGSSARLALAFYYHSANCDSHCQFYVGFVASSDGGKHWTKKIELAGPMSIGWLPLGRNKVGDYISTSFCEGNAFPVFSVAHATSKGHFNEAMYTIVGGLSV